jgi:hypothetical protein
MNAGHRCGPLPWAPALALVASLLLAAPALARHEGDHHVGYYYPDPEQIETYKARAQTLEGADRRRRIGFVVSLVSAMLQRPYAPTFAIFVKGDDADKLILVSYREGRLNTIYRVRALLATLTSVARTTPIFQEFSVEDIFTFLDLLKMLGFKQITVSDGNTFAHQILIE